MAKNGYGILVDFWAVPMQLNVQGGLDNWKMLDLDTIILSPKRQILKWVTIDNLVLRHIKDTYIPYLILFVAK